jgi:hypothetical protein
MLVNIDFQREGGLTDIGRFRGGGNQLWNFEFRFRFGVGGTPAFRKRESSGGVSRSCFVE